LIRLLSDEVPPKTIEFLLFYFNIDPLLFGILLNPSNPAWDDLRTPETETSADVTRHIFTEAVRALEKAYGRRVEEWRWKRAAPFTLSHSFGGEPAFPMLNRTGLLPAGTASSVFMHKFVRTDPARFPISYGPALRIVVDFSDFSRSSISIPGGQSGRPFSPNYDDILPLFMKGNGVRLEMDYDAVEKRCVGKFTIMPGGEAFSP